MTQDLLTVRTSRPVARAATGRHASRRRGSGRDALETSSVDLFDADAIAEAAVGRHAARRRAKRPASRLRSATVWSYAQTLGKMVITTGLSLVLAAMLGPRAFGVIAMALVFTNFIEMIQQQGLMPAIISRKILRSLHADTAFWLVLAAGVMCTAAGLALAPLWAGLNGLPELTPVIQALALGVPLTSSVIVHEALLRRRLAFKKLAVRSWSSVLAGGVAGVAGAFLGWGVWALVAQQLVMNVTTVAVLWGVSTWRPRRRFSRTAARELWSYSVRSSSSSLGLFLGSRVDVVLAGALFGPVLVGLYRLAQRLTSMVVDVTARSMQAVSLPGLASVQDQHDAFARRLLRMIKMTSALALPVLGILAGVAPAVEHVLGDEWSGTVTAIRILVLGQAFTALTLLLGPAMQARGRPGTLAVLVWIWAGTAAAALLAAAALPVSGDRQLIVLCTAMTSASATGAVLTVVTAARCFGVRIVKILGSCGPSVAAGVCAAAVAWLVQRSLPVNPLVAAFIAAMLAAAAAVAVLALLDSEVRTHLKPLLQVTGLQQRVRSDSLGEVTSRSRTLGPGPEPTSRD